MNLASSPSFYFLVLFFFLVPSGQSANATRGTDALKTRALPKGTVLNLREFGKAGLGGDDTQIFQRALAEASRQERALQISATRAPYRVAPLYLRSNTTVLLDSGVTIQSLPGFADGQKLLNVADANAVQVIGYGAVLKMDRAEYKSGQYRHCISIAGSSLVAIKGITCLNAGGDGVYVGGSERKPFSEDVTIEDIYVKNSVSAGLQVVSARNLTVRRSHFIDSHLSESEGSRKIAGDKSPGIQIAPNGSGARLENVRLEDTATAHSDGDGIRVVLSRLNNMSTPISVQITRHHDTAAGGSSFLGIDDPPSGGAARGYLSFEDCQSEGAQKYGAVLAFWDSSGVRASFRGLTVLNPNSGGSTMDNAAIAVKRGGGGHYPIGNVEFVRTTIRDTRRQPKLDYYFSFADYSHIGIQNVIFRDPVQLTGARHKRPLGLYQGEGSGEIQRADDPAVHVLWQTAEKRVSMNNTRPR